MTSKKIQNTIKQTLRMYKGTCKSALPNCITLNPSISKRTQKLKGKKYNRPKEKPRHSNSKFKGGKLVCMLQNQTFFPEQQK